jgi:ABC-type transporter Mla maintaining outer membrane lipid asymmetry permease subunit MlaE
MTTLTRVFEGIGAMTLSFRSSWGRSRSSAPVRLHEVPRHLPEAVLQTDGFIGILSSTVVMLTGMFTGMVSALQTYHGFKLFGAESLVGSTTALGLFRELGPSSPRSCDRKGRQAMTAEIGTMQVTSR